VARRPLSRKKKLLFSVVALLIALVTVELTLRVAGFPKGFLRTIKRLWATEGERSLGPFRPNHDAEMIWPPELTYRITTNSLGLRGSEPTGEAPRVLCVGDSTTFGSYVADNETFPAHLADELEKRSVKAQVINGGCPRWTITDENEFLARAVPELKPKFVVLLFCGNDLAEMTMGSASKRAVEAHSWWSNLRSSLAIGEASLWMTMQGRRAYLKARGRWPKPLRPDQGRTDAAAVADLWGQYEEELSKAKKVADDNGAKLILGAFPGYLEIRDAQPGGVETRLIALAAKLGIPYVDHYAPFRANVEAKNYLLPHDAHASSVGNHRIAESYAKTLAELWDKN